LIFAKEKRAAVPNLTRYPFSLVVSSDKSGKTFLFSLSACDGKRRFVRQD
jgi:hypothetical protein